MSAKVQWTAAQQAAIRTRGSNLLVAAAAGSGKTAVLVERIITMITDEQSPVDLDRLLIVTFTKAAASEMKERIGEAITKKIEEHPKDKRLHRQLSLLNKASITTIHSFCLEVVRNHFHVVELDPHFRIGDEFEMNLLKIEALDELFEELYENKENTLFASLVECYAGKKDDGQLVSMIQSLYTFVQSSPWPQRWLEEMAETFQISEEELDQQPWMKMLKETISVELEGVRSTIEQAIHITQHPDGPLLYEEALLLDLQVVEALQQSCNEAFNKGYETFQSVSWAALSRKKQSCDDNLKERVKKLRDEAKKAVDRIKKKVFFRESHELLNDLQRLYPLMKELVRVTLLFDERFKSKKRERNVLDFNDLEHYCLEILMESVDEDGKVSPSEVALQYKKKFEEVLIDEYQDSNLVQETLLSLVSRKERTVPNLFMVGDVKQSIYRFRMAKPELFLEKYNTFSMEEGAVNLRIDLDQNFRSRENILYGTNFIFSQIMTEIMGEMDYDAKAALYPGANYPELEEGEAGGAIELHLIEKNNIEDEKDDTQTYEEEIIEELEPVQIEARVIIHRIRELMKQRPSFRVFDKEQKRYRSMQYKDIVILLRATQNWAPVFVEELLKDNIPAYADASTGYFDAIEIQIILSVLKIIDNPRQDLPLITVLRSSIVGISAEDLAALREVTEEGDFYDTLLLFIDKEKEQTERTDTPLLSRIEKFLKQLERWRLKARLLTVQELLQMIYLETQYFHFVGALPGGVQRQANLRALMDRAKGFENSSIKGLFHFVSFIEKLKNRGEEMGLAKIMGENENVVRIMSIHKSKGLEFPVVFVAGMGKGFNLLDMNQSILLHQEYGFGPLYIDFEKRVQYSSLPRIAIKEKVYKETLSEEMRILYVALTRAKEKLILIGSERNIGKKCEKWSRTTDRETLKLPPYHMLKAKTYLDWVGPCIARHKEGLLIREMAGVAAEPQFFNSELSEWKVYYHEPSKFIQQVVEEIKEESKLKQQLQQGDILTEKSVYSEEIVRRLEWEYEYKKHSEIPAKLSVSQIKKLQMEQKEIVFESAGSQNYPIPNFMKEKQKLTGAEKGTLIHNVMQYLDFSRCENIMQIDEQLENLIERKLLTLEQKNQISVTQLFKFFESPLAKRMIASEEVKKEIPFIMEFEYEGVAGVLLQGVIDAYFLEGDELVLVDYKTDYTTPEKIGEIVEKYTLQLDYYSQALERILGITVKEKYLYLFSVNQAVLV